MTLAEKLGQLTMVASSYAVTGPVVVGDSTDAIKAGTIGNLLNMVGADHVREVQKLAVEQSRLKIPLLIGFDVIHGHRTLFPVPLGEAALFDPSTWEMTAREAAKEAAADGIAMTFAPMLDVARDPRWGRGVEGPGEDPFVGIRIAQAKVRGFQGADLAAPDALAACAKHYCAYGAVLAGRDYASADVSERTVHEVYLPPFESAVASGVVAVMPAFSDLAGIPMTANKALLKGWLRERLGFKGVIVTDYHAIAELINHGIAGDLTEAAVLALKAGVDIDMMSDAYRKGLPAALDRKLVTMDEIDASVRRVLELKERLGLFDDPFRRGTVPEPHAAAAHRRQLARSVAGRALVLLKNEGDLLPLAARTRRLAVIGPLGDAPSEMRGPWAAAGDPEACVSVLAGLRAALGSAQITHAAGADIESGDVSRIGEAVDACAGADVIVLCVGEAARMSGEASCRAHLGLPGQQRRLAEAVLDRAETAGTPVIVVLFSGRPLIITWLAEKARSVLAAFFPGTEAGNAIADVITGRVSPGGRTPVTWPRAEGQIPIFFGERPSSRPADPNDYYTSKYLDVSNAPLYPFGHGLSFGRFVYSNLRVSPAVVEDIDTLRIQVDVRNEGARAAEETAFLFIRDKVASVARPLLELKGFERVALEPGASATVKLSVRANDLKFLGIDLQPVYEPGEVEILVGPCADRTRLLIETVRLAWSRPC
jgi:beta-glucosidase